MAAEKDGGGAVPAFVFSLGGGKKAMTTHTRRGSATIVWTITAVGGANDVPVYNSKDEAVSIAVDRGIVFAGPGKFSAAVSGGTCAFEGNRWLADK